MKDDLYSLVEDHDRATARSKAWIQTFTGLRFEVLDPKPAMVRIEDIAHALSNLCRFTGHCKKFYSVAEHCVRVSQRCEELVEQSSFQYGARNWPEIARHAARWGLLHDAPEAFVADLNRPLKHQRELALYREVEARVMGVIAEKFKLGQELPEVHVADDELLWTEARDLMTPLHPDWPTGKPLEHVKIACWEPQQAELMFLKRYWELWPEGER